MWHLALQNVRSNISRLVATLVAIVVGVAFLTAGSMLTASISNSFGGDIDAQYANVNAAITPVARENDRGGGFVTEASISPDIVAAVSRTRGVAEARGEVIASTSIVEGGRKVTTSDFGRQSQTLRTWFPGDLNPQSIDSGRAPTGDGEIAIDRGTASDQRIEVGASVKVAAGSGAVRAKVVGLTTFGTSDSADQTGTITAAEPWVFSLTGDGTHNYSRVLVRAESGVTDTQLVADLAPLATKSLKVETGAAFRTAEKGNLADIGKVLGPVLAGFAYLALFVCAFVIYNTFAVVVTQRTRELALMRAVAATPKQISRSLRTEGLLIGLLGSAMGLIAGALLTLGLTALFKALDLGLPTAGIVVTPWIVARGLIAGTLVTLVAVLGPARRASKTAPVAAMRDAAIESTAFPRRRTIFALVLVIAGAALLIFSSSWFLGIGALLFALGLLLLGPALVVGASAATRRVMRVFGIAGRLSADNLARAPKRTATTTNALIIGLLLVTLVTVGGTSLRDYAVDTVNKLSSADFIVSSTTGAPAPAGLLDRIGRIPGVTTFARLHSTTVTLDDQPLTVSAGSAADLRKVGLQLESGSWNIGDGQMIASTIGRDPIPLHSSVNVVTSDGRTVSLEAVSTFKPSLDTFSLGVIVDQNTLDRLSPANGETGGLITVDPKRYNDVQTALDTLTAGYAGVRVSEGNQFGRAISSIFNFLINAVNALLGMSVIIALIGIVNTLSLSIFERRRELGLLRAVGMSAREVRRMIRLEAVQMSVLGTIVGMLGGTFLAWTLIRAADFGGGLRFDGVRLAIIAAAGVLVGLVAALIPTRRVTRLDILESLAAS